MFYGLSHVDVSYNLLKSCEEFMTGSYYQNLSNLYLCHIKVDTLVRIPDSIKILSLENCHLTDGEI